MDYGLFVLRLLAGGTMLVGHGLDKISQFSTKAAMFADPFGVGTSMSLGMVVFAEVVCAALVAMGLFTRLALIPLIINMSVAFGIVHAADPFRRKELAFLYLGMYVVLFLTGPGRYSVQSFFRISAGRFAWLLK